MPPRLPPSSLFPPPAARSTPPSTTGDWLHAHCDGGARGNPGPAGYGALLEDSHGNTVAELSEFLGLRTNNYAEYSGLLGCLQYALDHGHRRLKVVSDSELMVKQIQGKYQVKSPDLKPLFDEARRRIALLDAFEIAHALRHKNKDADRLANEAMDRGTSRSGSSGPVQSGTSSLRQIQAQSTRSPQTTTSTPSPGSSPPMLRGFTRNGVVHLLGSTILPDGIFVKIIPE